MSARRDSASAVSLYQTAGKWDTVNGSRQQVILTSAQASIIGGSNAITMNAGSSISLYGTSGKADAVTGSSDSLALSSAEAALHGSQDTVAFLHRGAYCQGRRPHVALSEPDIRGSIGPTRPS